ncbi:Exosome complex component Rrp41 [Candidatus Gugararchaeum adminiculabundum]|nr:Exosome complex component Rrp41 [Candidatus Gugararchaeum adminiculabundum]
MTEKEKPELFVHGKRLDGRTVEDLRPLKIQAGVLNSADGSAFVQWGNNKVLAGVYGPRECIPKHDSDPYKAVLKCRYNMAPFCSSGEHSRSGPSRRSTELSKVIREVFEGLILTDKYPKTMIEIYIEVLQSDGGTRCAAVTAAAVALADAGIPMRDMVAAVASGKIQEHIVADLGKDEDNYGQSDFPVAVSWRDKEILLFQMDGLLTRQQFEHALNLSISTVEKVKVLQKEALLRSFEEKNGSPRVNLNL